jgi:two-component system chemotaxis response regulator CheY
MDGVTMIRKIRALPQHTDTPIFVLSADATSSRLAEGRAAGATAWVIKATDPELLWNGIEKVLQRRDRLARTGEDLRK